MEWLAEYGLFLAKSVTVLIALFLFLAMVSSLKDKNRRTEGALTVTKVNEQVARMTDRLGQAVLDKPALKAMHKARKLANKNQAKGASDRNKVFVLNFNGDIKASALENLRQEVTAVLELATPQRRDCGQARERRRYGTRLRSGRLAADPRARGRCATDGVCR